MHIPQIHVYTITYINTGAYIAIHKHPHIYTANYTCIHIPCMTAHMFIYMLIHVLIAYLSINTDIWTMHIIHVHMYIHTCNNYTDAYTTTHIHCTIGSYSDATHVLV